MPVGPTGVQFSAVYSCHTLAKHTILAGFQFNPGGYLSQGFVFDPGGFLKLLKSIQTSCDVIINNGEQSVKYYIRDASNMCMVGTDGHTGWSHFRQKRSDKNHTGLSPHGISEIRGFVFTSDQVCSKGSTIIGTRIGTYFSHGFGVYSCIFGMYPSAWWFLTYYTDGPYQGIIALRRTYLDTSTWYSSYTVHVGISFPTVATHSLR